MNRRWDEGSTAKRDGGTATGRVLETLREVVFTTMTAPDWELSVRLPTKASPADGSTARAEVLPIARCATAALLEPLTIQSVFPPVLAAKTRFCSSSTARAYGVPRPSIVAATLSFEPSI